MKEILLRMAQVSIQYVDRINVAITCYCSMMISRCLPEILWQWSVSRRSIIGSGFDGDKAGLQFIFY